MAGEIRIDWAEGFRMFTESVTALRGNFSVMGEAHAPIPVGPPAGAHPNADVSAGMGELSAANEQAIAELAKFATDADRGLAGLAYVSAWMGANFPATDAAAGRDIAGLVDRATTQIPPPRENLPSTDTAFLSAPDPGA